MNGQAGKGDTYRRVDPKKWGDNYDRIFRTHGRKYGAGMTYDYYLYCPHCRMAFNRSTLTIFNFQKVACYLNEDEQRVAGTWIGEHTEHGRLELLHQDDPLLEVAHGL